MSYLNEIVDTMESVGNKTLAIGKPGRVLHVRSYSSRCYTEGPPQPLLLHITHPKNQKEKSFKVFTNVDYIFHKEKTGHSAEKCAFMSVDCTRLLPLGFTFCRETTGKW